MSGKVLLKGGRVVDPSQQIDAVLDVLLADGLVASIGEGLSKPEDADVVDCSGLLVSPGLIDVHVHLREPGDEHKETIATGARAAAGGGFTAICAMPNTDPPIDDPAAVGFVAAEGRRAGAARVYPVGCISVGRAGERLAPVGEMVDAGAVAITDDGSPVMNSGLMRLALEYAQTFGIPVADHPEDLGLSAGGQMNEGVVSTRLGLSGKPNAAEDIHIIRDILLAELTGGHIHLQHVSSRFGVESIRRAKARGVHVTAEASPHHLVLTETAVEGYRTDAKMNPPLRTAEDVDAVRAGLAEGTLDIIATDHAPHHYDEKEAAFGDAPDGIQVDAHGRKHTAGAGTVATAGLDSAARERFDRCMSTGEADNAGKGRTLLRRREFLMSVMVRIYNGNIQQRLRSRQSGSAMSDAR